MQFIINQNKYEGWDELAARLNLELRNGKKVLWLVSGGSNIEGEVYIINRIPSELKLKLSVMLADERYGDPGHKDSNERQLRDAGFDFSILSYLSILDADASFEETLNAAEIMTNQAFDYSDIIIGQLGIGDDGHIAGILLNSEACYETDNLVVGYLSNPYKRITLTFNALSKINSAYIFAYGDSKYNALVNLKTKNLDTVDQPAQILKRIKDVYVYNSLID